MEGVKSPVQAIDEFVMKRIKPVLIQELHNKDSIHLYSIGEYWRAFDKSAYALSLILPDSESTLLTVRDYPLPVLMVSAHYEAVNKLLFTKVVAKRNPDYIHFITKPIDRESYRRWRDELLDDMQDWDEEDDEIL
ncbi:MAG: hypothetical protein ACI4UJ_05490 [Candidatus Cryptobacteroides sp.]